MIDTFARVARPPRTAIAWATKTHIFCEIPTKDGPPYVLRYSKTAKGLAQALGVIVANPDKESKAPSKDHPKVMRKGKPNNGYKSTLAEQLVKGMRPKV